ncbi:PD-(D/E)XK motif protein [Microbacterium sp. KRD172]|uniref:PD-(D/E)XK motif protein n=1 Tax=Microbacterium sp. KRD172 TaxID=2729727 RepID=UPI0019D19AC1|nr:PD-(D/E)XK motif protein [Microbacterium sp. KRD172]
MTFSEKFALALAGINLKAIPLHHDVLSAYAVNAGGKPALLVKVPQDFDRSINGTRGIDVHVDAPNVVDRFISFRSESTGMTTMFDAVVDSLLGSSNSTANAGEAIERLLANFEQLQAMFASRGGMLTEDLIRGLFAELLMLLELRAAGFSADIAVNAWQGPYRSAKDFILPGGKCVEVKSLRRTNHHVNIANTDQLDPRDEDLRLAVVRLEKSAHGDGRGILDLVHDVKAWAAATPSAHISFTQALDALDFDVEDPRYEQWRFQAKDWAWYKVLEDFPRVRQVDVPPAVSNVSYRLDIDQIKSFESKPFWTEQD